MEPCRGSDPGPNPGPGAIGFFILFLHKGKAYCYRSCPKTHLFAAATFSITKRIADKIIIFLIFRYTEVLKPMYFQLLKIKTALEG